MFAWEVQVLSVCTNFSLHSSVSCFRVVLFSKKNGGFILKRSIHRWKKTFLLRQPVFHFSSFLFLHKHAQSTKGKLRLILKNIQFTNLSFAVRNTIKNAFSKCKLPPEVKSFCSLMSNQVLKATDILPAPAQTELIFSINSWFG